MIAIQFQYHSGDMREAEVLARFIADLEPNRRSDVKFRFIARKDTPSFDMNVIKHVSAKFETSWTHSESTETGWPKGPNGIAYDILLGGERAMQDIGWYDVDAFLMLEPDCVPLSASWLDHLIAEWEAAKLAGKWMMGSWRNSGPAGGHINGNCIIRADIARLAHLKDPPIGYAWDCYVSEKVKATHWFQTGLIRNDFRSYKATEEQLRTPEIGDREPVLSHGFKDHSAMNIARKWILP